MYSFSSVFHCWWTKKQSIEGRGKEHGAACLEAPPILYGFSFSLIPVMFFIIYSEILPLYKLFSQNEQVMAISRHASCTSTSTVEKFYTWRDIVSWVEIMSPIDKFNFPHRSTPQPNCVYLCSIMSTSAVFSNIYFYSQFSEKKINKSYCFPS